MTAAREEELLAIIRDLKRVVEAQRVILRDAHFGPNEDASIGIQCSLPCYNCDELIYDLEMERMKNRNLSALLKESERVKETQHNIIREVARLQISKSLIAQGSTQIDDGSRTEASMTSFKQIDAEIQSILSSFVVVQRRILKNDALAVPRVSSTESFNTGQATTEKSNFLNNDRVFSSKPFKDMRDVDRQAWDDLFHDVI